MKPTVYLETTIASYLVADRSRDLMQSAHQKATREWRAQRGRFDVYVSRPVLQEAARGDARQAGKRLAVLGEVQVLAVTPGTGTLANRLLRSGALPPKARLDAVHVAIVAMHGMDYLLTWNLRHLAGLAIRGKIEEGCRRAGVRPPVICTPEELLEA